MAVVNKEKSEIPLGVHMMPRDVTIRWNSTFDMLNFAVTYRRALESLTGTLGMGLQDYELSDDDWVIAKDLRDILEVSFYSMTDFILTYGYIPQVFKDATLYFSEGTPHLAKVIPAMDLIDAALATMATNPKFAP